MLSVGSFNIKHRSKKRRKRRNATEFYSRLKESHGKVMFRHLSKSKKQGFSTLSSDSSGKAKSTNSSPFGLQLKTHSSVASTSHSYSISQWLQMDQKDLKCSSWLITIGRFWTWHLIFGCGVQKQRKKPGSAMRLQVATPQLDAKTCWKCSGFSCSMNTKNSCCDKGLQI